MLPLLMMDKCKLRHIALYTIKRLKSMEAIKAGLSES